MKLSSLFMAIFLLGLSIIPCADDEVTQNNIEAFDESSRDPNHESGLDLCSPFCVCHCCHTHFVVVYALYNDFISLPKLITKSRYIARFSNGFRTSILQPPQEKYDLILG
ncbi:DUF6660 family protein [Flexithrix dorotheae]|uniref:DUF6660 family protein n=1 Tax=Flexithrix dorotheae TaxID=70993 RepID=UPI0012F754DF|nr:DUF6660 family protein [Flexithrix dorotheae]